MCKYCNNKFKDTNVTPLFVKNEYDYVIINGSLYRRHFHRPPNTFLAIAITQLNYCPMCGQKIDRQEEK